VTSEMLTALLSGAHFNMEERIQQGAWPHPPLRFHELVAHLANVIESRHWFPQTWHPAEPGALVADLTVIERRAPNDIVVYCQRSGPTGFTVAARGERAFRNAADAASFYLATAFHLPGDLDGWRVVR